MSVSYISTRNYLVRNVEPAAIGDFARILQQVSDRRLQTAQIVGVKTAYTESEWSHGQWDALVRVRANNEVHAELSELWSQVEVQEIR